MAARSLSSGADPYDAHGPRTEHLCRGKYEIRTSLCSKAQCDAMLAPVAAALGDDAVHRNLACLYLAVQAREA